MKPADIIDTEDMPSHEPIRKQSRHLRRSKACDDRVRVSLYNHTCDEDGHVGWKYGGFRNVFDPHAHVGIAVIDPNGNFTVPKSQVLQPETRKHGRHTFKVGLRYYKEQRVACFWEGDRPDFVKHF